MKKFYSVFSLFLISLLFVLPFLSCHIKDAVSGGIRTCLSELIPSLFPFLFLSSLTSYFASPLMSHFLAPVLCPLLGITPPSIPAIISGILGGFPSGAAESARLYSERKISKEEAERLPLFCNNAGLMFTVGTIGAGHFSSFKAGLILYFFHIFSSVICAVLTRDNKGKRIRYTKEPYSPVPLSRFPELFTKALKNSVCAMAMISGNFIVFSVFTSLLFLTFGKTPHVCFIAGLFEVTGGLLAMKENSAGLILSAFLLSFNGFCVHMQSMSFFAPLKLSMKKCILGKIFCAFLSALLMYISLPKNFMPKEGFPPMAFYVVTLLLPLVFFIPYIKKRASGRI